MLDNIKQQLSQIKEKLIQLRGYLDLDNKKQRISELSEAMASPGFWKDNQKSAGVVSQLKVLKAVVQPWDVIDNKYKDLVELVEVLDKNDADLAGDINKDLDALSQDLAGLEFKTLLSGEFDYNNAIISINAGAGGTEACDWAGMIFRMYSRWAEKKAYKLKTTDSLYAEEGGVKNITFLVDGEYAYGYLKSEKGVHRLVRISPFDANKRRHTSFASVDVIPEIEEDIQLKLEDKDLSIETFRASGPGGQHMQKSDSAVRIIHLPTGIVVQCQNERSQYQNKQTALKILKARLYQVERQKKEEEFSRQFGGQKQKIEWGSQIRSYTMHPYTLVKDHRTEYESGNVNAILDGEIDVFIQAYLKMQKPKSSV
ncbi:MAG: peptide chain release factor 2 [Candidatus Omnitrophota bacterium]